MSSVRASILTADVTDQGATMATPDPTSDGKAYREFLFGLVGKQDPADIQSRMIQELRALIARAGTKLRTPPAPGEWSVLELLGHMTDAELVSAFRYRQILSHDEPEIAPYDQDRWVARLGHNAADPEALLRVLSTVREANLALWRATRESERARAGIHLERGRETYEDCFMLIAGHDLFHLDQIRKTFDQVSA